jgi:hypothetical protein
MTTDVTVETTVISVMGAAMAANSVLQNVGLIRGNQPTQQGTPSGPFVSFWKITERNWGSPKRGQVWNAGTGVFDATLSQACAATWQFQALAPQDPADEDQPSESDVLQQFRAIMQTDAALAAFRAQGIRIERIMDVRNPYFTDDRDRYEASPSFDVVLTFDRNLASTLPAVVAYDATVSRV